MVWKKDLTAVSKGGTISKHAHKGFRSQPTGRNVMATLHDGEPGHRSNNDYGKRPPSPAPKLSPTPNDEDMYDNAAFPAGGGSMNDHDEDDA